MTVSRLPTAPILLFTLLAALWCGPARAIVGQSTDDDALAPHVVMVLQHVGATAGFCTGVVVAQDVVLTAAHCVPAGADLRVHLPSPPYKPVLLPVIGLAVHPDYRPDAIRSRERSVDLALVRLKHPLPAASTPAALAHVEGGKVGESFTVAGFGVTQEGQATTSGMLRATTLILHPPESSLLLWATDPQGRGGGACTGDSGGPVVATGTEAVAALVLWSAGIKDAHCGALTQAVWLWPQRAWINRVFQAWGVAPYQ